MSNETYLRTENDPPPGNQPVIALYQDPTTGRRHKIRAKYVRRGIFEATDAAEETLDDSCWDWISGEPHWPEGWYEEAVSHELVLYPLEEGSALSWREFPTFDVPESKENRQ